MKQRIIKIDTKEKAGIKWGGASEMRVLNY
jgi:hypothetical protein